MGDVVDLSGALILSDDVVEAAKVFGPRHRAVVVALGQLMMGAKGLYSQRDPRGAEELYRRAYATALAEAKGSPEALSRVGGDTLARVVSDDPVETVVRTLALCAGLVGQLSDPEVDADPGRVVGIIAAYAMGCGMAPAVSVPSSG